jgi:hypothetical protein
MQEWIPVQIQTIESDLFSSDSSGPFIVVAHLNYIPPLQWQWLFRERTNIDDSPISYNLKLESRIIITLSTRDEFKGHMSFMAHRITATNERYESKYISKHKGGVINSPASQATCEDTHNISNQFVRMDLNSTNITADSKTQTSSPREGSSTLVNDLKPASIVSDIGDSDLFQATFENEYLIDDKAYRDMLPKLVTTHNNKYVAIHKGGIVDINPDETALIERIRKAYPTEFVLIRRVATDKETMDTLDTPDDEL